MQCVELGSIHLLLWLGRVANPSYHRHVPLSFHAFATIEVIGAEMTVSEGWQQSMTDPSVSWSLHCMAGGATSAFPKAMITSGVPMLCIVSTTAARSAVVLTLDRETSSRRVE